MTTTLSALASLLKQKTGTLAVTREVRGAIDEILKTPKGMESRARLRTQTHNDVYRLTATPRLHDFHNASRERRLEASLWRHCVAGNQPLLDDVRIVAFQVPLYARQKKAGLGSIDLLGATPTGEPVAVELKVASSTKTKSGKVSFGIEPLVRPVVECAVYLSALQAQWGDFRSDWSRHTNVSALAPLTRLNGIVLAPDEYWNALLTCRHCKPALDVVGQLMADLARRGFHIRFASVTAKDPGTGPWEIGEIRERHLPGLA